MEYALVGWPADNPTLHLDHERFAYAGKFVVSNTGKAVAREDDTVAAAAAFDADRTDESCLRIRYVTVRDDRRGEGIGSTLLRFVVVRARERGFVAVKAGVNNPLAYEAFYKAGLAYTGEQTGLAELVVSTAADRDADRYRTGLSAYRDRDLSDPENAFLDAHEGNDPPSVVDVPDFES